MRNENNEVMSGYYPTFIETIIELKIYASKLISKHRNETYVLEPDHEFVEHSR
jgi:hypothetical protein